MQQVSQTIASITWFGWAVICLAWMFIGSVVAEISIRSAARDIDRSRVRRNGRRVYSIKEHRPSPWTFLMFPHLFISGMSEFCEARDHNETNYRIWMVFVGPIKIIMNVMAIAFILGSLLLSRPFRSLKRLIQTPWRAVFDRVIKVEEKDNDHEGQAQEKNDETSPAPSHIPFLDTSNSSASRQAKPISRKDLN